MKNSECKYFAFISYSSKDIAQGRRLQHKLERYKELKPVFFAPSDIQPGGLSQELKGRLETSGHLIVVCSPHSAKSEWVAREIEYFHNLGRTNNIHFFIVEGEPHSANPDSECLNPVVSKLGIPEILGANIHEKVYKWQPWLNKERAYIQLISKLLGVEFDSIWKRRKRQVRTKIMLWILAAAAIIAALFAIGKHNVPEDITFSLSDISAENPNLPPLKNAIVSMELDNEVKTDTISNLASQITFHNIPHKYLGKDVRVKVSSPDYLAADTLVKLSNSVSIKMLRDPSIYGNIRFQLWNIDKEAPASFASLKVEEMEIASDSAGMVNLTISLSAQKMSYSIKSLPESKIVLEDSIIRMPNSGSEVVMCRTNLTKQR